VSDQIAASTDRGNEYWPKGWYRFPLIPVIRYSPEDKYNRSRFSFHWMCFRIWDSMAPHFGVEFKIELSSIDIRLNLPYLYTGIFIPLIDPITEQRFWRTKR
jgi:hypothetical protein